MYQGHRAEVGILSRISLGTGLDGPRRGTDGNEGKAIPHDPRPGAPASVGARPRTKSARDDTWRRHAAGTSEALLLTAAH